MCCFTETGMFVGHAASSLFSPRMAGLKTVSSKYKFNSKPKKTRAPAAQRHAVLHTCCKQSHKRGAQGWGFELQCGCPGVTTTDPGSSSCLSMSWDHAHGA